MFYFAYGYNMKTERLKERVGEVNIIGKAILKNHCLKFNKLGDDGSGKANIEPMVGSVVEGVLFDLTEEQLKKLDTKEGVPTHYVRCRMEVIESDNNARMAEVYVANQDKIRSGLKPNHQYLQCLIEGANEHNLSNQYKKFLTSFKSV